MVYLSRIYTKTGDGGETGLGDGSRVPKDHPRVAAYGEVDELNSLLGVMLADAGKTLHVQLTDLLNIIQNDLFDVGADLCWPEKAGEPPGQGLRIQPSQVERLEKSIDLYNDPMPPLKSFILPGGTPAAAWCHLARTVCRRAERCLVTLMRTEAVNPQVLNYLNRLSDLLFVFAREINREGPGDVLWVPGQNRK